MSRRQTRQNSHMVSPPGQPRRSGPQGGDPLAVAANVVTDPRFIVGAVISWKLLSRVLKRPAKKHFGRRLPCPESGEPASSAQQTVINQRLEAEIEDMRALVAKLKADNESMAAHVDKLQSQDSKTSMNLRKATPKGLAAAFDAVSDSPFRGDSSASEPDTPSVYDCEVIHSHSILRTEPCLPLDVEVRRLQQENLQLRIAVESLQVENDELADRLLEVAFPDPSCSWGSPVDSEDGGNEADAEDAGGASVLSTPARAEELGEVAAEVQVAATPRGECITLGIETPLGDKFKSPGTPGLLSEVAPHPSSISPGSSLQDQTSSSDLEY